MTSVRIELSAAGTGGGCFALSASIDPFGCFTSSASIDRVKPSVLESYIKDCEWNQFCNNVDAAMAPANRASKIVLATFPLALLAMIGYVISNCNRCGGPAPKFPSFVLLIIYGVLLVVPHVYALLVSSKVKAKIREICKDFSQRHYPQVSLCVRFHVHDHHSSDDSQSHTTGTYIEASINDSKEALPKVGSCNSHGQRRR